MVYMRSYYSLANLRITSSILSQDDCSFGMIWPACSGALISNWTNPFTWQTGCMITWWMVNSSESILSWSSSVLTRQSIPTTSTSVLSGEDRYHLERYVTPLQWTVRVISSGGAVRSQSSISGMSSCSSFATIDGACWISGQCSFHARLAIKIFPSRSVRIQKISRLLINGFNLQAFCL